MQLTVHEYSGLPTCTLLCSQYMMDGIGNRRTLCHVRVIRAACLFTKVQTCCHPS